MQIRKGKSNTRTQWLNPKKLVKSNQIYSSIFEESRKCNLRAKHLGKKKNVERITKTIKLPRKKNNRSSHKHKSKSKQIIVRRRTQYYNVMMVFDLRVSLPKRKGRKRKKLQSIGYPQNWKKMITWWPLSIKHLPKEQTQWLAAAMPNSQLHIILITPYSLS